MELHDKNIMILKNGISCLISINGTIVKSNNNKDITYRKKSKIIMQGKDEKKFVSETLSINGKWLYYDPLSGFWKTNCGCF